MVSKAETNVCIVDCDGWGGFRDGLQRPALGSNCPKAWLPPRQEHRLPVALALREDCLSIWNVPVRVLPSGNALAILSCTRLISYYRTLENYPKKKVLNPGIVLFPHLFSQTRECLHVRLLIYLCIISSLASQSTMMEKTWIRSTSLTLSRCDSRCSRPK